MCTHLGLAAFTQLFVRLIHIVECNCRLFILIAVFTLAYCVNIPCLFLCSTSNVHLGSFQFSAIRNYAIMVSDMFLTLLESYLITDILCL